MNLLDFCNKDDPRPYINKPIRSNGFLYATNGHLFVRVNDDESVECADWYADDTCNALEKHIKTAAFDDLIDVKSLDITEPKKCGCGDLDFQDVDCDDCDGFGIFCHGNHEYDCKECDGTGKVSVKNAVCETCKNTHTLPDFVKIGENSFNAKYIRLITTLSNAKISTKPVGNMCWFNFDDGVGAVVALGI